MTHAELDDMIRETLNLRPNAVVLHFHRALVCRGMRAAADMCDDDPGEMGEHIARAIRRCADELDAK